MYIVYSVKNKIVITRLAACPSPLAFGAQNTKQGQLGGSCAGSKPQLRAVAAGTTSDHHQACHSRLPGTRSADSAVLFQMDTSLAQ
jgi:hypothetical protein